MARTRWPPGPVNPGLLPGQADQTGSAGGCHKTWARPTDRYQDSPSGVSRFGGQAGTQAPDPTPPPSRTGGSRAGSTTHILSADSALSAAAPDGPGMTHRISDSAPVGPVGRTIRIAAGAATYRHSRAGRDRIGRARCVAGTLTWWRSSGVYMVRCPTPLSEAALRLWCSRV
jgi:hypothetical protein